MEILTREQVRMMGLTGLFAYYRGDDKSWVQAVTVVIQQSIVGNTVLFKNGYYPVPILDIPEDGMFIPLAIGALQQAS